MRGKVKVGNRVSGVQFTDLLLLNAFTKLDKIKLAYKKLLESGSPILLLPATLIKDLKICYDSKWWRIIFTPYNQDFQIPGNQV